MHFEYSDPQTEIESFFGGFFHISAFGRIEEGDDEKFIKFLERTAPPPRTLVYINSGGGHVEAAMAIGRSIRQAWFSTSIGTYVLDQQQVDELIIPRRFTSGKCISAATLMFLGGRLRYFTEGSEFGVHQFSFRNPTPENLERSQRLSAAIATYIAEMGIPAPFLEVSAGTRGDQIKLLTEEELTELKVITGGITEPTWGTEIYEEAMWVRGERDSLFGHGKVLLVYSKKDGFAFSALVETMGRDNELMNHPLVEIVVNDEDIRIDISDRCARAPSGIYTIFIANISKSEAQLLATSKSFGIQVRASAQAEIFLGIAAIPTAGAESKLLGLYNLGAI
ncbi:hypothetical protein B7W89_18780 [Agrobacterium tumefaciens]|uniref:COG3904 family protein n=1 Tax=Agrobacterium tumefaciens TaxID=358 RepID=UPI000B3FA40B|nr:hypothetical protein [Agrobacterium tumefaciens]NSY03236.1 hypothetical protein [Agrobacterium tumefaciens]OVE87969.1 hypothetical protein B7W89_18780 [Agrobacterium tumefaciens]